MSSIFQNQISIFIYPDQDSFFEIFSAFGKERFGFFYRKSFSLKSIGLYSIIVVF
nr:MAG TPA: hypothetical protein [Caudoviricetes sp.]